MGLYLCIIAVTKVLQDLGIFMLPTDGTSIHIVHVVSVYFDNEFC